MKPEISNEEHATYDLFKTYLTEANWTSKGQMVANIFNAHHTLAVTCEQVEKIADALNGTTDISLELTLVKMVKAKVLRSRKSQDRRLYEVNY